MEERKRIGWFVELHTKMHQVISQPNLGNGRITKEKDIEKMDIKRQKEGRAGSLCDPAE